MEIKNYKELCSILEIKTTTGEAKQKQLRELELYCKYKKQGNKFIIEEVCYKPTLKLEDILKTSNNKYIWLLSNIIIEYLYNNPNELQEIPLIKLFGVLGMTSNNFHIGNMYKKELSQLKNVQLASIYYFYDNTRNEYKKIIERCLNGLKNRSILDWTQCKMIIDKKNKTVTKADEETNSLIIDTQKEVLEYMGYDSMSELMKTKTELKKFNELVSKEIGFSYFFAYNITVGEKAIQIEYNKLQKNKEGLNNIILDRSNKIFQKGKYINYAEDYKILIDLLVNTKTELDSKEFFNELYHKKQENIEKYKKGVDDVTSVYNENVNKLKIEYLDIYK